MEVPQRVILDRVEPIFSFIIGHLEKFSFVSLEIQGLLAITLILGLRTRIARLWSCDLSSTELLFGC